MTKAQAKNVLIAALRAYRRDCRTVGEQTGALIALEATLLAHSGQHAKRVWRILDLWTQDPNHWTQATSVTGLEARLLALRWYDVDLTGDILE